MSKKPAVKEPVISYQYTFALDVDMDAVEANVLSALLAVESLHGQLQTRESATYHVSAASHTLRIEATRRIGWDLCRIFTGFVISEFGDASFSVYCETKE